jgi:hypothetical protein
VDSLNSNAITTESPAVGLAQHYVRTLVLLLNPYALGFKFAFTVTSISLLMVYYPSATHWVVEGGINDVDDYSNGLWAVIVIVFIQQPNVVSAFQVRSLALSAIEAS